MYLPKELFAETSSERFQSRCVGLPLIGNPLMYHWNPGVSPLSLLLSLSEPLPLHYNTDGHSFSLGDIFVSVSVYTLGTLTCNHFRQGGTRWGRTFEFPPCEMSSQGVWDGDWGSWLKSPSGWCQGGWVCLSRNTHRVSLWICPVGGVSDHFLKGLGFENEGTDSGHSQRPWSTKRLRWRGRGKGTSSEVTLWSRSHWNTR